MGGGGGTLIGAVSDGRLAAPVAILAGHSAVRGLFLAGSHGRGHADRWSDIDLVAVADGAGTEVRELRLEGDRAAVREAAVEAVLALLLGRMSVQPER